jgi:hypothetical protein
MAIKSLQNRIIYSTKDRRRHKLAATLTITSIKKPSEKFKIPSK